MLARSDFNNVIVKKRLQMSNNFFPSSKRFSCCQIADAPNIVILFILTYDREVGRFFQLTITFNVIAIIVNDVYVRCFHPYFSL